MLNLKLISKQRVNYDNQVWSAVDRWCVKVVLTHTQHTKTVTSQSDDLCTTLHWIFSSSSLYSVMLRHCGYYETYTLISFIPHTHTHFDIPHNHLPSRYSSNDSPYYHHKLFVLRTFLFFALIYRGINHRWAG